MRYTKSISYYKTQKETFANKYSYYDKRDKKWGERYGYTLEPPMKLEEVENYEHTFNLQLPKDFRNYLLNISSETMGVYPYKVDLLHEPVMYFIHESKNVCPYYDNECNFDDGKFNEEENLDDDDIKKLHELGFYKNYFIRTHSNGCTDDDFLCIKGPKYGKAGSHKSGADYFSIDD